MKHTITETKIRSIVRKELQSYLIQEGLWDTIRGAVQNLPVAKQLSTLSNLGIDSDTLKSLAKTKPQDLAAKAKDAVNTVTNTPEYIEINTILSGINIGSTQLSQAYNLVYSKSKKNKNVYTFAQTPPSEKQKIIEEYTNAFRQDSVLLKNIEEYFKLVTMAQRNTIKAPLQERRINEAEENIDTKRNEIIKYINKLYQGINSELASTKTENASKKTYEGLLSQNLQVIFMFVLQVLNELVTNPSQHQPTKIVESIKKLFETIVTHLGKLNSSAPAAAEPAAPPTAEPTV